jgi:uncharacterized membrane protein YbhN (UPF0104 family)
MQLTGSRAPSSSPRTRRLLATLSATFWILVLAVIGLFTFFVALGAFNPAEVAGLSAAVAVLAALWVAHAAWVARHRERRDPRAIQDRERRGF